ncbi:MAG: PPC domain-containing protein, partial [Anaerolineae bacterium]|nr:PPC domain-containing protein [Anaerolineae bacterium]
MIAKLLRVAVLVLALSVINCGGVLAAPAGQERISLAYGQTVTGTLDHIRFFQQYSFEGQAGDRVVVTMETLEGNLDPLLLLGDATLNLIAEDDDGAGGFDARLEVVLPASGTYIIEATRFGQDTEVGRSTGSYQLTLIANQADSRTVPQLSGLLSALQFGETQRGLLQPSDRSRLFWFQAQANDRVRIQGAYSGDLSATLTLYDPQLQEIARDSSGSQLLANLESGGVYWVGLASNVPESSGSYALTLSGSVTDPQTGEASAYLLAYNERVEGTIADDRVSQRYQFSGRANDQVIVRMDALQETLDPFLYIYGPDGEIVGQDDDGGGSPNAEIAAVLPYDGVYTI